jgi:hypothetical protein
MRSHSPLAKNAPVTLRQWFAAQVRVKQLRGLLLKLRLATPAVAPLPEAMSPLLNAIAAAEHDEHRLLQAIVGLEQQHADAKRRQQLQRPPGFTETLAQDPPRPRPSWLLYALLSWRSRR